MHPITFEKKSHPEIRQIKSHSKISMHVFRQDPPHTHRHTATNEGTLTLHMHGHIWLPLVEATQFHVTQMQMCTSLDESMKSEQGCIRPRNEMETLKL